MRRVLHQKKTTKTCFSSFSHNRLLTRGWSLCLGSPLQPSLCFPGEIPGLVKRTCSSSDLPKHSQVPVLRFPVASFIPGAGWLSPGLNSMDIGIFLVPQLISLVPPRARLRGYAQLTNLCSLLFAEWKPFQCVWERP